MRELTQADVDRMSDHEFLEYCQRKDAADAGVSPMAAVIRSLASDIARAAKEEETEQELARWWNELRAEQGRGLGIAISTRRGF